MTIGYDFLSKKISQQCSKRDLREQYIEKYLNKFQNYEKDGMINCLKRAHASFEDFLRKLEAKIFVIKLPEGVKIFF